MRDASAASSGTTFTTWVYWTLEIQATYDTDLDFRTFPFDVQNLTIFLVNPYPSITFFYRFDGTSQPDAMGSGLREREAFNGGGQPRVTIFGEACVRPCWAVPAAAHSMHASCAAVCGRRGPHCSRVDHCHRRLACDQPELHPEQPAAIRRGP